MNLFRQLAEKPWTTPGHHAWAAADGAGGDLRRTAVTGLKLYFAAATVMFGLILAGYLMSGSHGGEHNMPQDWRPLPKNWLLWYNSGILVLNSLAWHWALTAARQGNARVLQRALAMAGALGFVFLLGQLAVWRLLEDGGYFMTRNMAVAFFYVLVVLHGLHLIGGLIVWSRAFARLLGSAPPEKLLLTVDLCARYWHFLLVVWLAMFGLLMLS